MSTFVIYARKSSESEDRQVMSIDSQIRELKTLASRQGVVVSEVLTEAHSAKSPGRPVFSALMKRVQRGDVRGILAWKMDRLARNHFDTGTVLQALSDGVLQKVITIDRTYTQDGNDRFIGNFELGMATKYIDDLRQNVKRGIRAKLQQGWVHYTPPLGYQRDLATKTVVNDPTRFDLIRRMWDLLLTGRVRPDAIVNISDKEWGFRTRTTKRQGGKPITHSMIYRLFQNPFYMGIILIRKTGERFVGAHVPMVSKAEFEHAQQILGRDGRARPQRHEFPLTGLVHCGTCGSLITAEVHVKPSGRTFTYYRCGHKKKHVVCRESAVPALDLEAQIAAILGRLAFPTSMIQQLRRLADRVSVQEVKAREDASRSLADSLRATDGQVERLLDLRLRDMIDEETFAKKRQQIVDRKARLEEKLTETENKKLNDSARVAEIINFAAAARDSFVNGTSVQKRIIVEALGLNSTLTARKVVLQLKNPFDRLAENVSMSNLRRGWEDVRTFLLNSPDYFVLPDLNDPVPKLRLSHVQRPGSASPGYDSAFVRDQ